MDGYRLKGATIFPRFYLSPSPHPSYCPLLSTPSAMTLSVFLSTPHLALSRTSLTVKNTKDWLCVSVLNIWGADLSACVLSILLFYFFLSFLFLYFFLQYKLSIPQHITTSYVSVCVCLSPEALQQGLILSILQSPLPSVLFIYLFIPSFFHTG